MIKKVFISLVLIMVSSDLFASFNKVALEIARSNKIDLSIKRVNNIFNFINLYVLQSGSKPANFAALLLEYPGIINTGFTSSNSIDFTITNNIIKFTNVVPSTLTPLMKQLYENNVYLSSMANVNADLSIDIILEAKTQAFLNKSTLIEANDVSNTVDIQSNAPNCANNAQLGNLWYRPNGTGEYFVYTCYLRVAVWQWEYVSNRLDIAIYRDTTPELYPLKPIAGTRAYVRDSITTVKEYVYSGDDGNAATNDWRSVSTP